MKNKRKSSFIGLDRLFTRAYGLTYKGFLRKCDSYFLSPSYVLYWDSHNTNNSEIKFLYNLFK